MIDFKKKTFLLAETVQEMRLALSLALSTLGARKLDMVSQSREVIRRLEQKSYDVIICDYLFSGGIDGLALLQEINERRLIKQSTVFMIVTTERSAHKVLSALEYDPDDYVLKPFTPNVLMKRLEKAILRKGVFASVGEMIQNHDYASAIAACDVKIREGNVHKLEFMKLKGRLSMTMADYEGAQVIYEQVLATHPVAWATMGLGKSLHHQQEFAKAAELFQSVVEQNSHVMEAYDWLADSHKSLGELKEAQKALQTAVRILPNDIKRQQALGEAAWESGDLEVAESAFRLCVALEKQEASLNVENHIRLGKVLFDKGNTEEALSLMREVRLIFPNDQKAELHAALVECMILKTTGDKSALALYDKAKQDYASLEADIPVSMVLDMISDGLLFADETHTEAVVRKLLKNNVEGPLQAKVMALYEKAGKAQQFNVLIENIRKELIDLNNRAVMLAKKGDFKAAVELFIQAVADMPSNLQFIANATNALLAYVNIVGWDDGYMQLAGDYIARIPELDPANPAFLKLSRMHAATTEKFASQRGGSCIEGLDGGTPDI